MSEIEDLKKELQALKDQINPPPRPPSTYQPRDLTEGMSMPKSAMLEMIKAVPESLMRELRADARRPNPVTEASSSTVRSTPAAQHSQPQRKGGWVEPRPLEPPPGVALADRLVDAQDARDRAELIERELKLAKVRMGKGDAG